MDSNKKGNKAGLVIGIVLIALALLADQIGLGSGGFGWKQITALVVGALLVLCGLKGCCCSPKK